MKLISSFKFKEILRMENNIKKIFLIINLLVFFLSGSILISGISVSPGKIEMGFVPNAVYEDVAKFGAGERTTHLEISTGGNFEIQVDKEELFCDVEPCMVNYKVIMPESFEKPGKQVGYIQAREVFEEERPGFIKVVLQIKMPVHIFVPYPGKYLELQSFTATNKEAGAEIPFKATLTSKGDEVIKSVRGLILVYDRNNNQIGRLNTANVKDIQPGETFNLFADWDSGDYEKGRYHADITVNYDGFEINETTNFKLGGLDVELINYTKEVLIGGIKPFDVSVESIWSESIPNMKAGVAVLNDKSKEITSFETITKKLLPWRTATLKGFLDTSMLNLSNYTLNITLFFENLTKSYEAKVSIVEPEVPEEEKASWLSNISHIFTIKTLLIVVVILFIVVIIFLAYILIPKKKDKKRKNIKKAK